VSDDAEFVWLRRELSWVGSGFIHGLPHDAAAGVADLERLGFDAVRLDGTKITDSESFHLQVAAAFGFPDYYGRNWDAFDECFGELEMPSHLAIVWTDADRLAASDLTTFAEAVAVFHEHCRARSKVGTQLALFIGVR
jgi:RNAse (barnase) inhibitor barstar